MVDSYTRSKEALVKILSDHSYKVVALSGKWGAGKTHLWDTVKKELSKPVSSAPEPIFISIFGAKTSNDLKLKLLQAGSIANDGKYKEFVGAGASLIKGVAGKFIPGLAVDELVLLSLPKLLGGRLVVIDDVERKHKNLDIDEVLGFINEYSENHKTRFLLLLNTDKLEDGSIWKNLHEKVVDIELRLQPTPAESFDIASTGSEFRYLSFAREAIVALGVTNIRVIRRILRVLSELIECYGELDDYVQKQTIPSAVLLTAIHYRGVASEITSDYVLKYNYIRKTMSRTKGSEDNPAWDDVIKSLGISSCGEYEFVVQDYLQTGIADRNKLDGLMFKHQASLERRQVQEKVRAFYESFFWDPQFDTETAKGFGEFFTGNVKRISGSDASDIAKALSELGCVSESEQLIKVWVAENESGSVSGVSERFSMSQELHPEIEALNSRIRDRQYPPLELEEAINRVRCNNSWGERELISFQQSTPAQYEEIIKKLRGGELGKFVSGNFSLMQVSGLGRELLHGLENFKLACGSIVKSSPESRLAKILLRAFESNGLPLEVGGT